MPGPRIFLVSDLHLGDGTAADRFLYAREFLDLLDRVGGVPGAELVVVGDLLELWACDLDAVMAGHYRMVSRLLALSEQVPITYVVGNHDALPWYLYLDSRLGRLSLVERYTRRVGGDTLVAIHGHQYDPFNRVRTAGQEIQVPPIRHLVALMGALQRVGLKHLVAEGQSLVDQLVHAAEELEAGRWPSGAPLPEPLRSGLQAVRGLLLREAPGQRGYPAGEPRYREAALDWMRRGARWVVMGHTHHPDRLEVGKRVYVNTGSWCWDRYPPTYALLADHSLELLDARNDQPFIVPART